MKIDIPGSPIRVGVPDDWKPVVVRDRLFLIAHDEEETWVGRPGYHPTSRGAFCLGICSDVGSPREAATSLCSGVQGDPDILDCAIGVQSVAFGWTDGVRWYRTWIVDIGPATLELDYVTVEGTPSIFDDDQIEAMAAALFDGLDAGPGTSPEPIDPSPRPRVFLSYGRQNLPLVERFVARLRARGFDPLWDAMLLAGSGFMEGIETFISHAHAFLPLITEHSRGRPWVHQEIGFARALNVPILPVMVGVAPDGFIAELHAAPLPESPTDEDIDRVIALLPRLIERAREARPPLYAVARGSLDRHELTARYLRQILDLDRTGCIRQSAPGGLFTLPDRSSRHPWWRDRRSTPLPERDIAVLRSLWSAARTHADRSGCRLVLDLGALRELFDGPRLAARLSPLREFLTTRDGRAPVHVAHREERDGASISFLAVGDWFASRAVRGTRTGWQHTMFTRHAPHVQREIELFDEELDDLVARQPGGREGSVAYTIERIDALLDGGSTTSGR